MLKLRLQNWDTDEDDTDWSSGWKREGLEGVLKKLEASLIGTIDEGQGAAGYKDAHSVQLDHSQH